MLLTQADRSKKGDAMNTLIELFDTSPIENVLATEMFRPKEMILICPPEIEQDRQYRRSLRAYFEYRKCPGQADVHPGEHAGRGEDRAGAAGGAGRPPGLRHRHLRRHRRRAVRGWRGVRRERRVHLQQQAQRLLRDQERALCPGRQMRRAAGRPVLLPDGRRHAAAGTGGQQGFVQQASTDRAAV